MSRRSRRRAKIAAAQAKTEAARQSEPVDAATGLPAREPDGHIPFTCSETGESTPIRYWLPAGQQEGAAHV